MNAQSKLANQHSRAARIRNAAVATIGNAIEWFDFTIFGFFAIPISQAFFPVSDPTTGLLASLGTFGAGFVARPGGAIVFGRLADRRGRRIVLIASILLMAVASLIIGAAPTYASVGIWGALVLLVGRLVQGVSAGAEFGSAVVYLVEWAPADKKGLYGSFHQFGACLGLIFGAILGAAINTLLTQAEIVAWGWRIPFLLGGGLAVIGLLLRLTLRETPEFEAAQRDVHPAPQQRRLIPILQNIGICALWTVAVFASVIYLPTFAVKQGGIAPGLALWATVIGSIFMLPAVLLGGYLTDRFGAGRMLLVPVIAYLFLAIPGFTVIANGAPFDALLTIVVTYAVLAGFISGVGPSAISGLFAIGERSTWTSTASAISIALFGGFAPVFSTLLIKATGWGPAPSLYVMLMAAATGVTALSLPRRGR